MVSMQVSITQDLATSQMLKIMRGMQDFRTPLQRCAMFMKKSLDEQFKFSGDPVKWKPLSPTTIKFRRQHSDKPLLDTGRLRRSYVGRVAESVYELTNLYVVVGSKLDYAALHQFGGRSRIENKSWFKTGKKGKPDVRVDLPKYTAKGKIKSDYKVKGLGTFSNVGVPARPLVMRDSDKSAFYVIFKNYINDVANKSSV